jgi:hypothetical protein
VCVGIDKKFIVSVRKIAGKYPSLEYSEKGLLIKNLDFGEVVTYIFKIKKNRFQENYLLKIMNKIQIFILLFIVAISASAKEYHVAKTGNDNNEGTVNKPFLTISAAAKIAQPGDIITVHKGTYRELVNPVNGGVSNINRIVYQAAADEEVAIKGSEIIRNWEKTGEGIWKVVIPNSFFGNYNPYKDLLEGDWLDKKGLAHHTGEVFLNENSLFEKASVKEVIESKPYPDARNQKASTFTWYGEVDNENTTIWANFQNANPNKELVEITVRESCFYPAQPGKNYITVKGFIMSQAATQWAAPTAEQIGLLGTHWSKGWIIEDNVISNSKCVGITLGKDRNTGHNLWLNNPVKDGTVHYNEVIFKALNIGWSKQNIGSHIVRNNEIFDCGQAGIVGSLGAVFSKIVNNHIYDIYTKRTFAGAEMGGIKIHGSIDMLIEGNHVHNVWRGIWMDWMSQGTKISKNLCYDNTSEDFFTEVNHGPYVVDNNIFLSPVSIRDWSEGGAYAHNIFAGKIVFRQILNRSTPYHFPHSTNVLGVTFILGGDNRYYNNIILGGEDIIKKDLLMNDYPRIGFAGYEIAKFDNYYGGNILYNSFNPETKTTGFDQNLSFNPNFRIEEKDGKILLNMNFSGAFQDVETIFVSTKLLGSTINSEAAFENSDGTPMEIDYDYFGNKRAKNNPVVGPIMNIKPGKNTFIIW